MKLKSRFIVALIIFAAVLAIFCGAFIIYVNIVVSEYDRVQPENIVEDKINGLKSGSLLSEIDFEKLCTNRYENNDPDKFKQEYSSKVVGKDLTYKIVASESGELQKTYIFKSGEENVGKVVLSGKNPRTKLMFFTFADWSLSAFIPVVSDTVYDIRVCCPEGIRATINGVELSEDEREALSGTPSYSLSGLMNEPAIKFTDKDGNEVPYKVEDNTVKPIMYDYRLTLPKSVSVTVNDEKVSGTPSGNDVIYSVREMEEPDILIKDCMGAGYKYIDGEEIPLFDYSVFVPENCTLSIDGAALPEPVTSDSPDAEQLLKYAGVTLSKQNGYTFSLFSDKVSATVSDGASSKNFNVPYGNSTLSPEMLDAVPEEITKEIDVLAVAKLWSNFMTDDIGGWDNGLSVISKYLIPDSEYYKYAKQWAYGIDITFIADHILLGFSDVKVSHFIQYSESCFSCTVSFNKNMETYRNGIYMGKRSDSFNNIIYFTKVSDGSWKIAVMHENLGGEANAA